MKTLKNVVLISALAAAGLVAACSNTPGGSPSLPAVSIPPVSVDPSAASAAVITALDQIETEIDANQNATGLTAEEADALKGFVSTVRSAVETGDMSAAAPAVDTLAAKLTELDAKLGTDAGTRLKDGVAQLKALLAAS